MHFYTWDSLKRLLSAAHTEQLERIYSAEELADRLSELQQAGHESEQVLSNSVVSRSSQELEQQKAAYKTYVDFVVHGNLNSVQQREQIFMLHFCAALYKHEEVRVAQAEQKEEKAGLSFMNGLLARTFAAMPGIALLAIFVLGKQCF